MSHLAVRDLTTKIARAARYDGPSLSIGPSDSSLPRMNVRNGSHALHLDLDVAVVIRTDNVTAQNPYSVWVAGKSAFV